MNDSNSRRDTVAEEIIDPELPICDCHHHLWGTPGRQYLPPDFLRDIGNGHNIVKTVFVESTSVKNYGELPVTQWVDETKFTHDITSPVLPSQFGGIDIAAGIVGFVDLTLGSGVEAVLEAHMTASDRFCGIRQICSWDANTDVIHATAPPSLLMDADFRRGAACLKTRDLSFETFIYHPQLPELVDMARALPDIRVIVNHIGGPLGVGPYAVNHGDTINQWKRDMKDLSACPNVFIKLGGLGMSICGFDWHQRDTPVHSAELAEKTAPYYIWCIEQFGVERCMFESNFPVDKASYSYNVVWNAFKRMTADFTPEERKDLFHDTAARAYKL